MNFKKAALLLALISASPAVTHAAARQAHSVVSTVKHHSAGSYLLRFITLGHKG